MIELRSDTFTKPTPAMRHAMATAEVGDDVWGEDPTVNALQERAAALFGKEAGLFVSSGSMGNQIGIAVQAAPGSAVLVDERSHVIVVETGSTEMVSGARPATIPSDRGRFDPDLVVEVAKRERATVLCLENTHMGGMGAVIPVEQIRDIAKVAHDAGLGVHMDGARLFNAAVASGAHVRDYAAEVDTITFCFSKGLGAPIGSMLLGTSEQIARARTIRKMLGGGMRQVGVIAAAAAIALEEGPGNLAQDHVNARRLAEGIAAAAPRAIDPRLVESNILYVDTGSRAAAEVAGLLKEQDVLVGALEERRIRCVTHRDVSAEQIERAIDAFARVLP